VGWRYELMKNGIIVALGVGILIVLYFLLFWSGAVENGTVADRGSSTGNTNGGGQSHLPAGNGVVMTEEEKAAIEAATEKMRLAEKMYTYLIDIPEPSYEGAEITTGAVFLYGRYIPPPYSVEIDQDRRLHVNGISLIPRLHADVPAVQVPASVTEKCEADRRIAKIWASADWSDAEEIADALAKTRNMDIVEDVRVGERKIAIKYKGENSWGHMRFSGMPAVSEERKKEIHDDYVKRLRSDLVNCLNRGGVFFWFVSGQLWGGMTAEGAQELASQIGRILQGERPAREDTVADHVEEREAIKKLTDRFNHSQIMAIIANWKR
jgi:hypothetical protein